MPVFEINIGNIPPLILHTQEAYDAMQTIEVFSGPYINITNDGKLKLLVNHDEDTSQMHDLIYNTLINLPPPKAECRRFIWVKQDDKIIKYIFATSDAFYNDTKPILADMYICPTFYYITTNDNIDDAILEDIITDCFRHLICGDIKIEWRYRCIYAIWSKYVQVNIEMAEIIANSILDKMCECKSFTNFDRIGYCDKYLLT